ncbi:2'-5' RNA ligase family protein [Streptomyces longwoodensis]|uniref:2'-5' RNA ligase family protein n=1 Tax=Streptomyces longwoodensis TaxID=68231 RepID=UPI003702ECC0
MADDGTSRFHAGQTALIARVPEAEPAVQAWRARYDPAARAGVPAHITVLFPYLPASRIDTHVHAALTDIIARHHTIHARFATCGRFPRVLYLTPQPQAPLRRLTLDITHHWPQTPPYQDQFTDNIPHLTIAQDQPDTVLDNIETHLHTTLPLTTHITTINLITHNGTTWQHHTTFPLQPDNP